MLPLLFNNGNNFTNKWFECKTILNGLQTVEEASECWNTGVLIKSKEKMQETQ